MSSAGPLFAVTNPATGQLVRHYPTATDDEVQAAVTRADQGFRRLKVTPLDERTARLTAVAEAYQQRRDELAALITEEMGKPIRQARGEVDLVATIYRYYAAHAAEFLQDEELAVVSGGRALVRSAPIGVLLGIMPWNYPYYQVARFAAPNLVIGNSVLLKHSPQNPASALAMEEIFVQAGFDGGEYVNIFADNDQVATIIADPRVQGVSLTGSERAGAAVAEIAGRNLKKVVLELGGSDPFIVLDTSDLDALVQRAAGGRLGNAGQACNSPKRFIVMDGLYDDFVSGLTAAFSAVVPGDPTSEATVMGPLSSETAANGLAAQVQTAAQQGATVLVGGHRMERPGAWFEPTVLTGVTESMDVFTQELFGPVAVVYRVGSIDEAVQLANATPFGLGACVNSDDTEVALAVADRLESGMVYINDNSGTAAELPFGGVKRSGIGRELGKFGMEEFVNKKLVRIR
jgi:succinate-semialdehyde dehydrogenase/glutarate-semialdehyde dehydrogenase